jgi:hypothetical protein
MRRTAWVTRWVWPIRKIVPPRPLSGMNDSMEWSHASLDDVETVAGVSPIILIF